MATVVALEHERGKVAPFAIMEMKGKRFHIVATEGVSVGDKMYFGDDTKLNVAMTAGAFCTIENHRKESEQTVLKLPSGQKRIFSSNVRAIIGVVAGAGVTEKPLLKAGTAHYLRKSRGQLFP
ncbi:unnamed protein product, partial [Medioppia subpectinata]